MKHIKLFKESIISKEKTPFDYRGGKTSDEKKLSDSATWEDSDIYKLVYNGDLKSVKSLLDNGADPNYEDNWPARVACKFGNLEILKMLYEHGAKIFGFRRSCLKGAAENMHWDIVDWFVENGDNKNWIEIYDWVSHSSLDYSKKKEALQKLKGYIDSGKCTA